MDKNSFYRSELRVLFHKYNVEQNEELLNALANIVGMKCRAAEGANSAVNNFIARFDPEQWEDGDEILQELYTLSSEVYGIVWQQSLEK